MTNEDQTPTIYIIAGPNGAGKTTFASDFLPDFVNCREFLNADLIAAGLSPLVDSVHVYCNLQIPPRLIAEYSNEKWRVSDDQHFASIMGQIQTEDL